MIQFIAVRLAAFVPTLLAISAVLFLAINVIPGGAAQPWAGSPKLKQKRMTWIKHII